MQNNDINIMMCPPPCIRRLHSIFDDLNAFPFHPFTLVPCPRPERLLPVDGISPAGDMYSWGSWMMGTRRGCVVLNRRRWHYLYCAGAPASISTAHVPQEESLLPP